MIANGSRYQRMNEQGRRIDWVAGLFILWSAAWIAWCWSHYQAKIAAIEAKYHGGRPVAVGKLAPHILFIEGVNLRLYRDQEGHLVLSPGPDGSRQVLTEAERQKLLAWLKVQFPEEP